MALGRCQCALPLVLRRSGLAWRRISTAQDEQRQRRRAPANAYEVLGLSECCSEGSIRAAFRELAKATHPDLQDHASSAEFVRILAAYEILSDSTKRAEYDKFLRAKEQRGEPEKGTSQKERSSGGEDEDAERNSIQKDGSEVVSWLRAYRAMVRDVVHRQEIGEGTGWEEELKGQVQSALKRAYFGPRVEEQEGMPECFEAEERAHPDVEDVLHLVSGRQLFGAVRQVRPYLLEGKKWEAPVMLQDGAVNHAEIQAKQSGAPLLSNNERVLSADGTSESSDEFHSIRVDHRGDAEAGEAGVRERSPYVDLELHLFGNVVARSIRVPVKADQDGSISEPRASGSNDEQDCIYVYLSSERVDYPHEAAKVTGADGSTLLGTVRGLRSAGIQSACFAHAPHGKRTHLILQHSTPMVKHMQWFRVGGERAACECRCRRASTLPSRYWIFEPRLDTHNVGGWYIETFRENLRSHRAGNVRRHPCQQDEFKRRGSEPQTGRSSELLHPAMYIMAAAYRTLDEEERAARRREASLPNQITRWADHALSKSAVAQWWRNKWRLFDMSILKPK